MGKNTFQCGFSEVVVIFIKCWDCFIEIFWLRHTERVALSMPPPAVALLYTSFKFKLNFPSACQISTGDLISYYLPKYWEHLIGLLRTLSQNVWSNEAGRVPPALAHQFHSVFKLISRVAVCEFYQRTRLGDDLIYLLQRATSFVRTFDAFYTFSVEKI